MYIYKQVRNAMCTHTGKNRYLKTGQKVWKNINAALDCIKFAAIVDEKIFCVHAGFNVYSCVVSCVVVCCYVLWFLCIVVLFYGD